MDRLRSTVASVFSFEAGHSARARAVLCFELLWKVLEMDPDRRLSLTVDTRWTMSQ
jgi:hypothetical protein